MCECMQACTKDESTCIAYWALPELQRMLQHEQHTRCHLWAQGAHAAVFTTVLQHSRLDVLPCTAVAFQQWCQSLQIDGRPFGCIRVESRGLDIHVVSRESCMRMACSQLLQQMVPCAGCRKATQVTGQQEQACSRGNDPECAICQVRRAACAMVRTRMHAHLHVPDTWAHLSCWAMLP